MAVNEKILDKPNEHTRRFNELRNLISGARFNVRPNAIYVWTKKLINILLKQF